MKTFIIALIVALSFLSANSYHVNYQAHGFNDLDFFIQVVQKGVNIFKFDISLSNESSCIEQTTWKKGENECELLEFGMPSCCLVMRGDTSPVPIWKFPSNTTNEFIDIFNSGKYDYIFSKDNAATRYSETKLIALNLQYGPYTVNNLTEDFLYRLFKATNDRNLNIEWIFGRENFIIDYDKLCASPEGCTEKQQYISDQNVIFQSDKDELPEEIKPRRWNFNTNYYNIEKFCSEGFPNWVDEDNEFPMIFWEPSHEDGMQWTYMKYFNYTCDVPAFKLQQHDYQQANNQEPEMQQVYTQGYNETIVDQKFIFNNKTSSVLEYIDITDNFIFGYHNTLNEENFLEVVNQQMEVLDQLILKEQPQYLKKTQYQDVFTLMVIEENTIEIVKYLNRQLSMLLSFDKPKQFLSADITTFQGTLQYYFVYAQSENEISISLCNENMEEIQQQSYDISFSGYTTSQILNAEFTSNYRTNQALLVFNVEGQGSKLFTFFIDLGDKLKNSEIQQLNSDKFENFAYGFRPVLKLYFDNRTQDLYFLIVNTNGYSQSGVNFNNGYYNKCVYYQYEEFQSFTNVRHAMTYIYGKVNDLQEKIIQGQLISSCSDNIHHAHFNNGKRPSIILKQSNKLDDDFFTAFVLHEYADYTELPGITTIYQGSNGRYIPNNDETTPRPNKEQKIPVYTNSTLFEYFSLVNFETFEIINEHIK